MDLGARLESFKFAGRGLRALWQTQPNARLHALATLLVVILGAALELSRLEWCAVLFASAAVWISEALNTALEFLADAVAPDHHPLIGKAKDVAAGAVLIASIGALLVAALVFLPHLAATRHAS
jgi:diacylglycerol kinase (ATP)